MHHLPHKFAISATTVVALAAAALVAQAQQPPSPRLPATPRAAETTPRAKVAPLTELDRDLLTRLIAFTEDQVALERLAQEKASRRDVKQLAGELLQDHAGMQTLMQAALATDKPATDNPATNKQATSNPAPAGPTSPSRPPAGHHEDAATFGQLTGEVNRQFQASVLRELSAKQGPPFDQAFLQSQVFAQLWLLDALAVFERNVSPDLKPLLQRWIQIAQYDFGHAKRLEMWIAQVGPNGPPASGIFVPRRGAATSGSAINGNFRVPRPRMGLSPLPTTTTSPSGKTVGPAQGSP